MAGEQIQRRVKSLTVAKRAAIQEAIRELRVLIPELIRLRTRGGAGLKGNLPALERSTIEYRTRYRDNLHTDTSPSESNLTGTGQLLNAIEAKASAGRITVSINKKKRRGELSGSRSKLTNDDVRRFVEQNFAEFFELTNDEREQLVQIAKDIIANKIREVFRQ